MGLLGDNFLKGPDQPTSIPFQSTLRFCMFVCTVRTRNLLFRLIFFSEIDFQMYYQIQMHNTKMVVKSLRLRRIPSQRFRAPAILGVDYSRGTLVKEYIHGSG